MKRYLVIGVAGILLAGGAVAWAQDKAESQRSKKRTIVDLTGVVIEGELTKPEGSYIVHRKLSRFKKMIPERAHFKAELLSSHNDL